MQRPKSFIVDCLLSEKVFLNDRYFLMVLQSPVELSDVMPGQFAQLKVDKSPETFLRRPISICMVNNSKEIWLLVQIAGNGTKTLSEYNAGEKVNLIIPLGNSFTIPDNAGKVLLVGGGVGMAPMLILGKSISEKGKKASFLLGARTKSDLLLIDEFKKYGEVFFTTEDGSYGEKGFVTNHSILENSRFDFIYTCGPKPMMQAVEKYARKNNIECEVSLENLMACGIGACLCCVEDTINGHVCTCTEGPVFNTKMLKW